MNNFIKSMPGAPHDATRLAAKRARLIQRARIIGAATDWFTQAGFLAVETPIRISAPAPELNIDAEPSGDCFLITSPELHMKRLLQAGYEKIFQLSHCFRRGERGAHHLPEFTMLEWYRLGGTVGDLMADCENILRVAAIVVGAYPEIRRGDQTVNLEGPFEAIEIQEAFEQFAGWRPGAAPDSDRFDRDLVSRIEPSLPPDRPVFLVGYPSSLASLARIDPENPERAERFELYAGGLELANGFQELTDPVAQRRRFEHERAARVSSGRSPYPLDEPFLEALGNGLKDCAGIALGVDRLVMLLTGATTIDEVVAFSDTPMDNPRSDL